MGRMGRRLERRPPTVPCACSIPAPAQFHRCFKSWNSFWLRLVIQPESPESPCRVAQPTFANSPCHVIRALKERTEQPPLRQIDQDFIFATVVAPSVPSMPPSMPLQCQLPRPGAGPPYTFGVVSSRNSSKRLLFDGRIRWLEVLVYRQ